MNPLALVIALALNTVPNLDRVPPADDVFVTAGEAKALAKTTQVRFVCADTERECANRHIAGSVFVFPRELHFLDDIRACKGLPMCTGTAAKLFGDLGIDASTRVIVYDSGMGLNASGAWFLLHLYGHNETRILDGGMAAWKAHGGALVTGPAARVEPKRFVPQVRYEMLADVEEVKSATADRERYLILDARHNIDEYDGKTLLSSMKGPGVEVTVERGGFIPTAVFSPWTRFAGNRGAEPGKSTLKDERELRKQVMKLKESGYSPDKTIITYCHVGLGRGSLEYLALKRAGHEKVKLYVGSWAEWGSTPALPLGTPAAAGKAR